MNAETVGPLSGGRISYLFITVRDLPGMLSFYRDTLGFEVLFEVEDRCAFLAPEKDRGPQVALYAGRETPPASGSHWFVVIDVDDIESVVAGLRERGVAIGEIEDVPYGKAATFEDPEGNAIEVHEPA